MSDNQDALKCAETLERDVCDLHDPRESAAHIRRLVAENDTLREDLRKFREAASCERDLRQEQERYATALVRQMLEALWPWDVEDANHTEQYAAITAAREWLGQKGETG